MAELLSRRSFLKLAGASGISIFLPPPPEEETENPFANIEGIPVLGATAPLANWEFQKWLRQENRKKKEINPLVRPVEILVGHDAWKDGYNGESCASFIRRHIDGFNLILGSSFPESGIRSMRVVPYLVVVDEQFAQSLGWWQRQSTVQSLGALGNANALGRWTFDSTYSPQRSSYRFFIEGKHYDSGLWHEWQHYWLYQIAHCYNDFLPTLDNWRTIRLHHAGLKGQRAGAVRHWNIKETFREFQTHSLHDVNHLRWDEMRIDARSPFSRFEQRMIKLVSELPDMGKESWAYDSYAMQLCEKDAGLALHYNFSVDPMDSSQTTALLYTGRVEQGDANSNQTNVFDGNPVSLSIQKGHIAIPVDMVAGRATNQEDLKMAKKYFLLQVGGRLYGFTSLHLLNWHFEEQQKQHGAFGPRKQKAKVLLNLADFSKPSGNWLEMADGKLMTEDAYHQKITTISRENYLEFIT